MCNLVAHLRARVHHEVVKEPAESGVALQGVVDAVISIQTCLVVLWKRLVELYALCNTAKLLVLTGAVIHYLLTKPLVGIRATHEVVKSRVYATWKFLKR